MAGQRCCGEPAEPRQAWANALSSQSRSTMAYAERINQRLTLPVSQGLTAVISTMPARRLRIEGFCLWHSHDPQHLFNGCGRDLFRAGNHPRFCICVSGEFSQSIVNGQCGFHLIRQARKADASRHSGCMPLYWSGVRRADLGFLTRPRSKTKDLVVAFLMVSWSPGWRSASPRLHPAKAGSAVGRGGGQDNASIVAGFPVADQFGGATCIRPLIHAALSSASFKGSGQKSGPFISPGVRVQLISEGCGAGHRTWPRVAGGAPQRFGHGRTWRSKASKGHARLARPGQGSRDSGRSRPLPRKAR